MDKAAYIFGSNFAIFFAYCLGVWPHSHIYTFSTVIQALLLMHRYYTFWITDLKFYLVDFCYLANFLLFFYINFNPKSQWLMITSYLYANGTLATGVLAFRNSLVYHKIDFLTSLATHAVPMILTIHIRWDTIPKQMHLTEDEMRFAPLPDMPDWSTWFHYFFVMPLLVYFIWLFVYGVCLFVITDKVQDYSYDSVYRIFTRGIVLYE